jgi:hypothetical protein
VKEIPKKEPLPFVPRMDYLPSISSNGRKETPEQRETERAESLIHHLCIQLGM